MLIMNHLPCLPSNREKKWIQIQAFPGTLSPLTSFEREVVFSGGKGREKGKEGEYVQRFSGDRVRCLAVGGTLL